MKLAKTALVTMVACALVGAEAVPAVAAKKVAPSAWTLTAAGPTSKGASVNPVMKKPRRIGLVVTKHGKRVGLVPLGTQSGSPKIPWNLRVNGKVLTSGTYVVQLKVFTSAGKPTKIPGPPSYKLVIHKGHVTVKKA